MPLQGCTKHRPDVPICKKMVEIMVSEASTSGFTKLCSMLLGLDKNNFQAKNCQRSVMK